MLKNKFLYIGINFSISRFSKQIIYLLPQGFQFFGFDFWIGITARKNCRTMLDSQKCGIINFINKHVESSRKMISTESFFNFRKPSHIKVMVNISQIFNASLNDRWQFHHASQAL